MAIVKEIKRKTITGDVETYGIGTSSDNVDVRDPFNQEQATQTTLTNVLNKLVGNITTLISNTLKTDKVPIYNQENQQGLVKRESDATSSDKKFLNELRGN